MRKLSLEDYTFGLPDQKGLMQLTTYQFKKTLVDILPHHNLGLNGPELLKAMKVVEKIEKAKGEILLSEEDYQLIVDTFKKFRGFQKYDLQFLKRIYSCLSIPDEEKDTKFSDNGKEKG